MEFIILEPIRRPPTPGERRGALVGFAWCLVILAAIGLARYAWLKRKGGTPEPPGAAALAAEPSAVADSPEVAANREADKALEEMGIAEGVLKQLFPTLNKPAAVASLIKRFELGPDVERRFLALIVAMEERTKILAGAVRVHDEMVLAAQDLKGQILRDVRAGGPLGSPELRDLWRAAVEAATDVDVPVDWQAQKIYDRVAAHQLVQRFDVAKQVVAYRQCGETIRRLVAVNEPLRRLMAALPRDVRDQTFCKIPREGVSSHFDGLLRDRDWSGHFGSYRRGCGSGLFWMFEICNLDPRMVHDDFELAAQDLERMLLLREPKGRVLNEFKAANMSPPGLVPRQGPEPLEEDPAWMAPRPQPTPTKDEVLPAEPTQVEPQPDPEPQPVKKRRPRRSQQLDPRDLFRW